MIEGFLIVVAMMLFYNLWAVIQINRIEMHRSNPHYWLVEATEVGEQAIWHVVCRFGRARHNESKGFLDKESAQAFLGLRRAEFDKRSGAV